VAAGQSNKAIAAELVISPATVARHIANIMAKLGFRSRAQIAAWVADRRLPTSTAGRGPPRWSAPPPGRLPAGRRGSAGR
jgi:hypothetical protein